MSQHAIARGNARGNPAWRKGGPSPNPAGRPKSALALADAIRTHFDPEAACMFVAMVVQDDTLPIMAREDVLYRWIQLGYVKPPQLLAVTEAERAAKPPEAAPAFDWSKLPEELRDRVMAVMVSGDTAKPDER